jgi:hypothetical protein
MSGDIRAAFYATADDVLDKLIAEARAAGPEQTQFIAASVTAVQRLAQEQQS